MWLVVGGWSVLEFCCFGGLLFGFGGCGLVFGLGGCDSVPSVACACCVSVCLLLVCVLYLVSVGFCLRVV